MENTLIITFEDKKDYENMLEILSLFNESVIIRKYHTNSSNNTVKTYCEQAFNIAKSKGWYDSKRNMGETLALIHSEVSEALEADRIGDMKNFREELADICIRVFDLCGGLEIDLDFEIQKKMIKNMNRPYKHGKRY